MSKYLLLLLPLFISGCPMGDRFNLYPAQSKVVDGKVCVFFDEKEIVRKESILKIAIWKHGGDDYVYEKSYAYSPVALEAGKCVPGIGEFNFIAGEGYTVLVRTPLNSYRSSFIVWAKGENIFLKPD
ncbi:putative T6SS immunity periplasmic lipoprotein [Serratia plymuthica]|uniref:putative T6SS immunity periplasmic lipoprotein n=1 Tax=Serratia plymuthica TaxID=82996 RepID=UPI00093B1E64|nr:putative T6SS immunity periplasmic lipoprotein [Serratia plymuthica]